MSLLLAAILAASLSVESDVARLVRVGGVHVEDDSGCVLVSWHSDDARTPASVLKLATGAAALHTLGADARITTDFVFDSATKELCVIGGGDPFIVTESLRRAADSLAARGITDVSALSADCGLFVPPLTVDGQGASSNPYDAAISAFSVNFNTVAVSVGRGGKVGAGEPETPLTPLARTLATRSGRRGVLRLPILDGDVAAPTYGLELIREVLRERGIVVGDSISLAPCRGEHAIIYHHASQQSMAGTVAAMLEYSNNMIANMLLLTAAATELGRPVGISDAAALLDGFLKEELGLQGCVVVEGSGLSRANSMTPRDVVRVLHHLRDHRYDDLLPLYKGVRAKTGTLNGVTCLAGYLNLADGRVACFAILLEGGVGLRDRILGILRDRLGVVGETIQ